MAPKPLNPVHAPRVEAYEQAVRDGFLPQGARVHVGSPRTAVSVAAQRLGLPITTLKHSLQSARSAGWVPGSPTQAPAEAPKTAAEARTNKIDADYWRKKAKQAEEALSHAEADLRVALGLTDRPAEPPKWTLPSAGGKRSKVMGLLQVSDIHNGEVVKRAEIHGVNEYSPDVMQKRVRRLFSAFVEVVPRWAADSTLCGAVVAVNGDLVSGDIHDELRRTNATTAFEQAFQVADELAAGIAHVRGSFGKVFVTFTPGNHGRTTEKTHAKRVSSLSYDMLIGEIVRRHFKDDDRVTVLLADGPDLEFSVLGLRIFQSHGDALGTGGGKGFAGPVLPIARGAKNVELQAYRMRKRHDVILTAHYHTSSNPARGVFANGSVVGYNEFANRIRASIEPPQQWAVLLHERWGVRERCEIVLDEVGVLTTDVG